MMYGKKSMDGSPKKTMTTTTKKVRVADAPMLAPKTKKNITQTTKKTITPMKSTGTKKYTAEGKSEPMQRMRK